MLLIAFIVFAFRQGMKVKPSGNDPLQWTKCGGWRWARQLLNFRTASFHSTLRPCAPWEALQFGPTSKGWVVALVATTHSPVKIAAPGHFLP